MKARVVFDGNVVIEDDLEPIELLKKLDSMVIKHGKDKEEKKR